MLNMSGRRVTQLNGSTITGLCPNRLARWQATMAAFSAFLMSMTTHGSGQVSKNGPMHDTPLPPPVGLNGGVH